MLNSELQLNSRLLLTHRKIEFDSVTCVLCIFKWIFWRENILKIIRSDCNLIAQIDALNTIYVSEKITF